MKNWRIKRATDFNLLLSKKNTVFSNQKNSTILQVIKSINNVMTKDTILVSDVGIHKQYALLFSKVLTPNSFICSNGLATFGFALPAAMAAKLVYPHKRVIAIAGDGGFHSVSHDLETARRYNLPITIIVVKDGSYGLIKHYQKEGFGESIGRQLEFGNVDFVKLAEANGCEGIKAESLAELDEALCKIPELPTVIEMPIKYDYGLGE